MRNENNRGTDVGRRRKTPRKLRGAEDTACKYYASTGQRFLLSKAGVSERVHTGARSAVDRGVRLARRPRRRLISLARRPRRRLRPTRRRCCTGDTLAGPADGPPHIMHQHSPTQHFQIPYCRCRKSTTFHSLKDEETETRFRNDGGSPDTTRTMRRKQTQNLFSILLIGYEVRRGARPAEIQYATRSAHYINGIIELVRACRARPEPPALPWPPMKSMLK